MNSHPARARAAAYASVTVVCLLGTLIPARAATAPFIARKIDWSGYVQPKLRGVLKQVLAAQRGHQLDLTQAQALARTATICLRQAGDLVALVLITSNEWQQFAHTGTLTFLVFEGRVGAVRVQRNSSHVASARLQRAAREALCPRGMGNCVLMSRGIERAQLLLQDIPGVKLAPLRLSPAGVGLGQTAVQIVASANEPRVTGAVSLDNYGVPQAGQNRAGISLSANNLLHMGDVWTGSFEDTNRHEVTGALGTSVPLGYRGLRLELNAARTTYSVSQVQASGLADTAVAGLSYPLVRSFGSDWRVALDGVWTRSKLTVIGLPAAAPRRIIAAQATLSGDSGERHQVLWGDTWSTALSVLSGDVTQRLSTPDTTGVLGHFTKITWTGLAKLDLGQHGLYSLWNARGQWSNQNLDPYEEMTVGGPTGARAFSPAEASVTRGILLTVQLRQRLQWRDNVFAPGVFIDYANGEFLAHPYPSWQANFGYTNPNLSNHHVWADYGLGLDWISPWGMSLSVTWANRFPGSAHPLYRAPGSAQNRWLGAIAWQF